jgi:hypothetical protein
VVRGPAVDREHRGALAVVERHVLPSNF